MSDKIIKSRNFLGVLYPDSESYICEEVLGLLDATFKEWAYVLHDKDTDDEGNPKKPHIHWIGKRASPVPISTISNSLGVPNNSVEFCNRWKQSARYLIHLDSPDKEAYLPSDIVSNFEISKYLSEMSDLDMAKKILDYVETEHPVSLHTLIKWCMSNGCWSEYRRSSGTWIVLLNQMKMEESNYENAHC